MDFGLLWFDNDPRRGLLEKVERAADHYHRKYGHRPNICFVHPSMMREDKEVMRMDGVEVRPGQAVLPYHLWIGVEEE